MSELANCPRCNAIYVKGVRDICEACYRKEEDDYDLVYTYIRKKKNRTAGVEEVANHTGVSEKTIRKFVKEGRLRSGMFPNLDYPCDRCGTMINEGLICGSCANEIQADLGKVEQEEKRKDRVRESQNTYYTWGSK
ncbi:membrane protein [Pontibacillus halophilus JSM 076056 = DSM 19796]|uniref:Membrane protein n=1 Tax=Pontibacillus halophilus JSM 076056 = DSM 19796 TaxID=1385510 RepID=A0A0A5GL07_9BACI|nr:TIGR03826 family flagellar region protein [Pontibacillus halophilus]KGX93946.1 membrane protein [Pontibacillus halophilus JSM 076056 = DSM 19796]